MKKRNIITSVIRNVILILLMLLIVFPFVLLISVSFSSDLSIAQNGYSLIPKEFTTAAYRYIFKNPLTILQAYKITAIYSCIDMVLSVVLMSLIAYPLSKHDFKMKNAVNLYLYITMLFGGGLVPTYILNTQYLHLNNTMWIYILPVLISPWYIFMMRTFFKGIPYEILESATIDGASEFRILFQMIYPLSKPVLASIALFTLLGQWNQWYTSMLYIDDTKLYSLQYLLQKMMKDIELATSLQNGNVAVVVDNNGSIPTESTRMAMVVVAAGPVMLAFPFFQKYFARGLTVGGVKG